MRVLVEANSLITPHVGRLRWVRSLWRPSDGQSGAILRNGPPARATSRSGSRRSQRGSLRFGRGAITGKCKQPPVVSAGLNQARKPSTTRRIDAVRIPGAGMSRRGGAFNGSRTEGPPDEAFGPNGTGMASSGSSSFGLPGSGVIRIHGWYRGAASTQGWWKAPRLFTTHFCPRSCRTTTPNFSSSLEGPGLRGTCSLAIRQ